MLRRFLAILTIFVMIMPVLAQDLSDEEQEYVETVSNALDETFAYESYSVDGQQIMIQHIELAGTEMDQEFVQNFTGDFMNEDEDTEAYMAIAQIISQNSAGNAMEFAMTMELLVNGDGMYIQVSDVDPVMLASIYPDEWILLDSTEAGSYEGLSLINREQMAGMMDARSLVSPVIDIFSLITDVEQLDDAEVNGVTTSVYRLSADPEFLFSDEHVDVINQMFNLSALGIDASALEIEVGDGAVMEYVYYIGQDDRLVYRTEFDITMSLTMDGAAFGVPGDFIIEQELTARFDFINFGESVKLPNP